MKWSGQHIYDLVAAFRQDVTMDSTLTVTGNTTLSGNLTFDSVALTAVQTSSESFADNDTSLMTSAAIDDRINTAVAGEDTIAEMNDTNISSTAAGQLLVWDATASVWDNVALTAGNLIDTTTGDGTLAVAVDLDELSTSTTDGDGDYFCVVDTSRGQHKLTKGNINISGFNNDSGFTTNTGDITGVTITADDEETASDTAGSADFIVAGGAGISTSAAGTTVTVALDTIITDSISQKFTVTGNTDGTAQGDIVYFGGTTSMTTGAIYHYKSDGTWELADADAAANCDGLLAVALGAASNTNGMLLRGMVTLDHDPGAVGDVLFLSTTAGDCSATAPSGNGDIIRVVGYCLNASNGQIWFNPDNTFVEVSA